MPENKRINCTLCNHKLHLTVKSTLLFVKPALSNGVQIFELFSAWRAQSISHD